MSVCASLSTCLSFKKSFELLCLLFLFRSMCFFFVKGKKTRHDMFTTLFLLASFHFYYFFGFFSFVFSDYFPFGFYCVVSWTLFFFFSFSFVWFFSFFLTFISVIYFFFFFVFYSSKDIWMIEWFCVLVCALLTRRWLLLWCAVFYLTFVCLCIAS